MSSFFEEAMGLVALASRRRLTDVERERLESLLMVSHRRNRKLEKAVKAIQGACYDVAAGGSQPRIEPRNSERPTRAFDIDETPTSHSASRRFA